MKKTVCHFCGCVTTYRLVGREWKLVQFAQRCDRRWRMGHFGVTALGEAEGEAEAAAEPDNG